MSVRGLVLKFGVLALGAVIMSTSFSNRKHSEQLPSKFRYTLDSQGLSPRAAAFEYSENGLTNNEVIRSQKENIASKPVTLPNIRLRITSIYNGRINNLHEGYLFDKRGSNNVPLISQMVNKTEELSAREIYPSYQKSMILIYEFGKIGEKYQGIDILVR